MNRTKVRTIKVVVPELTLDSTAEEIFASGAVRWVEDPDARWKEAQTYAALFKLQKKWWADKAATH